MLGLALDAEDAEDVVTEAVKADVEVARVDCAGGVIDDVSFLLHQRYVRDLRREGNAPSV